MIWLILFIIFGIPILVAIFTGLVGIMVDLPFFNKTSGKDFKKWRDQIN